MPAIAEQPDQTICWMVREYGGEHAIVFAFTSLRAQQLHEEDCRLHGRKPRFLAIEPTPWSELDTYLRRVGRAACARRLQGIGYLDTSRHRWMICRPGEYVDQDDVDSCDQGPEASEV